MITQPGESYKNIRNTLPSSIISSVKSGIEGFVIRSIEKKLSRISLLSHLSYVYRLLSKVPPEYRVLIQSKRVGVDVVARIQDKFVLAVDSTWETFLDVFTRHPAWQTAEMVALAFGVSLQMAVTSRRKWRSTSPVSITLPLVFVTETDSQLDVLDQVQALQMMAIPDVLKGPNVAWGGGLLIPPGPTPYKEIKYLRTKATVPGAKTDNISVNLGTCLYFDSVIIKSVSVTYDNRMSTDGKPIAARADVTFESYEIMTKPALEGVYGKVMKTSERVENVEKVGEVARSRIQAKLGMSA